MLVTLGLTVALSPGSNNNWKGAHREYGKREDWRNGRQQKLLDLDGIVDRGVDGAAARAGWKLRNFRRQSLAVSIFPIGETRRVMPAMLRSTSLD